MEESIPAGVFTPDTIVTSKYWETVLRKRYSQPEKELMLAVLKDAILNYRKRMHLGNILFKEVEAWLFERDRDRLFSFETVCAVLGLSAGKIRGELLAWKLNALSDLSGAKRKALRGHDRVVTTGYPTSYRNGSLLSALSLTSELRRR